MLTDLGIKKLPLPEKRREVPDGKVACLYLIVQSSGAKSWAVRYRSHGKPVKLTLGSYPAIDLAAARRRAQEALGEVAGGRNPAAAKKAAREARRVGGDAKDRLADIASAFVEKHAKRKAGALWAAEMQRLLRVEILPKLGAKRLDEITKAQVHDLLDDIVDRGSPTTANRSLAVLRKLGNWSVERGVVAMSPFLGIKPPALERTRDRVLSDDELRVAWRAFDRLSWPFGRIAQLLTLTGARRDEIAEARWNDINLDAKVWTVAAMRSKNGVAHEIPLSDAAVRIIAALPRIGDQKDGYVFTVTRRTPVSGWSRAKEQVGRIILELLREEAAARGDDPANVETLADWVFHDLRRTAASGMAGIGIAPHVVEAVLNHKSGTIKGVAAVYNRYSYAAEKRDALDKWAARVAVIVGEAS
ncbi:MAG: tyrosine-type recombinase/integrase [Hyphomicrobiales bacterium]|nr:tyrosine-type recombinase/integrase [Hyphomicrobiales bacterium]